MKISILFAFITFSLVPGCTSEPAKTPTTGKKPAAKKPTTKLPATKKGTTGKHWDALLMELNSPKVIKARTQSKILTRYGVKVDPACANLYGFKLYTPKKWGRIAFFSGVPLPSANPCENKKVVQKPPVFCTLRVTEGEAIVGKHEENTLADSEVETVEFEVLESAHHIIRLTTRDWKAPPCEEEDDIDARQRAVDEEESGSTVTQSRTLLLFDKGAVHVLRSYVSRLETRDSFHSNSVNRTIT
ncbi:hypothetical protein KKF84_20140, partial [Myxococcota bacterium]|nr:hypothetical protein [Myxococcota bacterium]